MCHQQLAFGCLVCLHVYVFFCAVNNLPLVVHWVLASFKKKSFNYKRIMSASRAVQTKVTGVCFWNWVLFFITSFISNALHFECGHVWTRCWEPVCVILAQFSMHCCFFADGLMLSFLCSFVSLSLGLSACNSSGHLSNHAEIAPSYAGITFAISNTLVSCLPISLRLYFCPLQHCLLFFNNLFLFSLYADKHKHPVT